MASRWASWRSTSSNSCEDRLRLVTFKTVNSLGEGDYYDGIASSMQFACAASDTLAAPMNDAGDGLTSAALGWLATGACGSVIGAAPSGAQSKTSADSRMADVAPAFCGRALAARHRLASQLPAQSSSARHST